MKSFLALLFLLLFGTFIFLKVQINEDPNSKFNQTTRFNLGKNGVERSILGLHNAGDARIEYLQNKGPLAIEWFKSTSQDLDTKPINDFAALVGQYTDRQTEVIYGGALSDGTVPVPVLGSFNLKADTQSTASTFAVFFTQDYSPRQINELSTTYKESGMIISISANQNFLQNYSQDINQYYLSDMLYQFGHQIGLEDNNDPDCIMNSHAGIDGQPFEVYGKTGPLDYCQAEKDQINKLKLQY
jgi:hypothetical protein